MKRSINDVLNDLPNVIEKNIPAPEMQLSFLQTNKNRKRSSIIYYAITVAAIVLIILVIPLLSPDKSLAEKIIYKGFNCPSDTEIVKTSSNDKARLESVLDQIIHNVYKDPEYKIYQIKSVELAPQSSGGYKGIIEENCSEVVFQNSWVIQLSFPNLEKISASLSQGQIFVAKTKDGWIVWEQYH